MPYAQQHYPFENKERFEQEMFPAQVLLLLNPLAQSHLQFIAEGLDQTRGWFYTLMVIGTALFDKAPFQNLVCNGLVLAEYYFFAIFVSIDNLHPQGWQEDEQTSQELS